ncbi:hypothetical protein AMTR_s00076p00046590 [Amborella trichopoda]|uniref:Uncharacterized protein n=1 Tax=Amborella trichopoda TaxID=13333 RepID=W1P436_AMBTC|nr:hypothetical protein AMTR_s00076p00046590 [Amborella trichopoda]
MSLADYPGILNHSPHQYPFSVYRASIKPLLLKWDQRHQKAEQGEADPKRHDYKPFKRKCSDVTSTGTKALPKINQQGTRCTEVMTWGTRDTRGMLPFPMAPTPFPSVPSLGPPSSSSNRIHLQDQNRIKRLGGRANTINTISNSARARALQ